MDSFLANIVPVIMVGLSLGSLFGLVGLAFTVIINSSQLVNFGQGEFAMVGVAVCWYFLSALHLPLWIAFPASVVGGALFGLLTERTIVTPLLKKETHPFYPILGTMAIGTIAAGVVGIYTKFFWMPIDPFLGREPWRFGVVALDKQGVLIIFMTFLLVVLYWFMLNRTRFGTALRATGYNREVSTLLGIQTAKMVGLSFMISGVIAAIAGVLCAPFSPFTAHDGLPLALNGFIALIIGGWGNPYAAVLGGVTVGLIRSSLTGYASSAHAELATFFVLILVLTLKPEGIFAKFMAGNTKRV
jgi:branched-chain amino acid transport system permease protein